jgi:hypothetical protein
MIDNLHSIGLADLFLIDSISSFVINPILYNSIDVIVSSNISLSLFLKIENGIFNITLFIILSITLYFLEDMRLGKDLPLRVLVRFGEDMRSGKDLSLRVLVRFGEDLPLRVLVRFGEDLSLRVLVRFGEDLPLRVLVRFGEDLSRFFIRG